MHWIFRRWLGLKARLIRDLLIVGLGLIWLVREWIVMPVLITGTSMLPTCQDGQIAVVNKLAFVVHNPQRGDLVAVRTPKELMLKRVVGLPGETVVLHEGKFFVDGHPLPEPYVVHKNEAEAEAGRLGAKNYLVIGDNRSGTALAVINESRILGRVIPLGWRYSYASTSENW